MKTFLLNLVLLLACALGSCSEAMPLQYRYNDGNVVVSGHGSCFAVDKNAVLTASHLLYSGGKLQRNVTITVAGREYPITLKKENKSLDLALCTVEGIELKTLEFSPADALVNSVITFIGYPRGLGPKASHGLVQDRFYQGAARDLAVVSFDHGYSGCPVLQDGFVVGMAVAGVPGKNNDMDFVHALYVPASVLKWFLSDVSR